jgi:ABC-type multidrug transport system ATPase subunit
MGPSASGKSVLLKALSGRIQDLPISGELSMLGKQRDPKHQGNPIAFVPQEDRSLLGELTAREVTLNTAIFKRNEPLPALKADVSTLLHNLGLAKVADGIVGTLIFVRSSFSFFS